MTAFILGFSVLDRNKIRSEADRFCSDIHLIIRVISRTAPEDVLVSLDQDGAGSVHHPPGAPHVLDGEDGALLPHVHVGLLHKNDIYNII